MSRPPDITVVLIATGPERAVASGLDVLTRQATDAMDVVAICERGRDGFIAHQLGALAFRHRVVTTTAAGTPGAVRNAAVRVSAAERITIVDGSELLPPGYLEAAAAALGNSPHAAFVASHGDLTPGHPTSINLPLLLAGPWSIAAPVVTRTAFERAGGFDESLPDLVLWDLLLTLLEHGESGMLTGAWVRRLESDDVHLREALRAERHLPSVRQIFTKHRRAFEAHAASSLTDRERVAGRLWSAERELLDRREKLQADLASVLNELGAVERELRAHGRSALEWSDLRRTAPLSRNWGLERGRPVDRHYIETFLSEHAADVRGHVLEMLDNGLTTALGGERVERSDVLDVDPANDRATIVADLRAADGIPPDSYDCFILTQTLHLIDDMPAALAHAHRILKPGGVLLVTLPCVSMVAEEYGAGGDHWRVTESGARRLFERYFAPRDLTVVARGNVLATAAFLYGLACEELHPQELDAQDPAYPLVVCIRAVKTSAAARQGDAVSTRRAGKSPSTAAVLLYHRVANLSHDRHRMAVGPREFRRQIEYLRRQWRPVPLATLADAARAGDIPDRAVALSFDDAYLDNLEEAAPVLAEFGVPATFFVTSEPLTGGRAFWWDRLEEMLLTGGELPASIRVEIDGAVRSLPTAEDPARNAAHDELYEILKGTLPAVRDDILWQLERAVGRRSRGTARRARALGAEEIRALAEMPGVDIGAHSVHHVSLTRLDPEHQFREVSECRSSLERVLQRDVTLFAYPFGEHSADAVAAVRAAGYRFAFTCEARGLRAGDRPHRLPRVQAPTDGDALEGLLRSI